MKPSAYELGKCVLGKCGHEEVEYIDLVGLYILKWDQINFSLFWEQNLNKKLKKNLSPIFYFNISEHSLLIFSTIQTFNY